MKLDDQERDRLRALVEGADWAAMGSEDEIKAAEREPDAADSAL
jgi:hypothetical protein